MLEAYGGAVAVSCSLAAGLGQLVKQATGFSLAIRSTIQKVTLSGHVYVCVSLMIANILAQFVPFTAVAAAGVVNVFLMRKNEITYVTQQQSQSDNVCNAYH